MLRLLNYDLKYGLEKNKNKLILIVVTQLCSVITFRNMIQVGDGNVIMSDLAFIDYYLYAVRGMEYYNITQNNFFTIPIYWFVYNILIAYMIGYYPKENLESVGSYCMLKSKSRINWWYSKIVWSVVNIFLVYITSFLTILAYTYIKGVQISFDVNVDFMKRFGNGLIFMNNNEILISACILPFLISCAVSIFQILVSLRFGAVFGFAIVCIMYILSVYYTSPFLLGNYTMWLRNNKVCDGHGYDMYVGIFMSLLIFFLSVLIGIIYLEKKDIGIDDN